MACPEEAERFYGLHLRTTLPTQADYEAVLMVVPHTDYVDLREENIANLLKPNGWVMDFKGVWRHKTFHPLSYWTL